MLCAIAGSYITYQKYIVPIWLFLFILSAIDEYYDITRNHNYPLLLVEAMLFILQQNYLFITANDGTNSVYIVTKVSWYNIIINICI